VLRALTGSAARALSGATGGQDRALRGLREAAERARLVPVATLFPALERLARDCARSVGCLARFQARGGEVRVEGRTLAAVNSALVQLVRNAVAHGIEPEAARRAAGKPAEGRVTVAVTRRGRSVVFSCEDDGCGLDLNGLRQALVQGGAPVDAARAMGPEALLSRLLRGGLSTAPVVTDASGRGLGLSVAREAAESLGGVLSARTEAGRGCAFDVTVPLALASFDALLVEAGGVTAAIPLEAVRGAARVAVADLAHGPAGVTATVNGAVLAFAPLPDLLGMAADDRPSRRAWNAALIAGDGATAALAVDRVRGVEHVLLRPLPPSSPGGDLVVGAFLDADGIPRLVLDPDALARAARGRRPEQPAGRAPAAVLVIDDSLTTRMLERSILESAGYQVDLAVSGEEALKMAGRRRYSLFLVDVEMPGMDGFTLVERFRADAALRDVPSILVTSRVSAEDRRRGEEVGAKGYIVKSEFDQNALLARMRDLIAKGP
ncbi:MAG: response regulator, partial [Planctomycetes bacterium]|nr:response regulator [Planctomycetota bacterium]